MKEDKLREMIRKQIKQSLSEQPVRSTVTRNLGRIEKMAAVKMLKRALGQGAPQQQAAGLLAVVKAISGDSAQVAKLLSRMLIKQGIDTPAPAPAPTANESRALDSKMSKLDKTQAMKMLRQTLKTKPATQQAEFVADLVKGLNLKGNITMLIKKIRQTN